jgi:hypothetical protein
MTPTKTKTLFPLGRLLITPGAAEVLDGHPATTKALLTRHATGDWSEMSEEDQAENQFSIGRALRNFSAYSLADETNLWIITEADRSATTILLPSEY